mmetsp:Transcript_916/g.2569  ORF Transcript_916/g.2569 Transcript_916/m.2569 type:complete len:220 (+) Transcript_916:1-660(+)
MGANAMCSRCNQGRFNLKRNASASVEQDRLHPKPPNFEVTLPRWSKTILTSKAPSRHPHRPAGGQNVTLGIWTACCPRPPPRRPPLSGWRCSTRPRPGPPPGEAAPASSRAPGARAPARQRLRSPPATAARPGPCGTPGTRPPQRLSESAPSQRSHLCGASRRRPARHLPARHCPRRRGTKVADLLSGRGRPGEATGPRPRPGTRGRGRGRSLDLWRRC